MSQKLSLLPGEEVAFQLEGDVFNAGASPLLQALARVRAFILKIFGTSYKVTLVVTNKRVMEYRQTISCYCVPTATEFKIVVPASVKEVGYIQGTSCCGICKYFSLYYQSFTQTTVFPIQAGTEEQVTDYVNKFYAAINS